MAISIVNNTIHGHGQPAAEAITSWEVWFLVPTKGLIKDREEAIGIAEGMDLDPEQCVIPMSVAVGEDGSYEPVLK